MTIEIKAQASATFTHKFFGGLEAEARRWINPDGSEGGIVALDATIDAKISMSMDVVIGPRASIGNGASIGSRASIGYGASIGNDTSIGYGASIGDGDWYMTVGPIGSRNAMTTAVYSKEQGLRWWVGCQNGNSTDALLERVKREHGDSRHADDYRAAIAYVQSHPGLARAIAQE